MFSFLVALTMFLTFAPTKPVASVSSYAAPKPAVAGAADHAQPSSLPLSADSMRVFGPVKKDANRLGVATTADAAFVVDWESGNVLFEKNPDQPQPIASITKLLTALVVLDTRPDWDKTVEVLPTDEPVGGVQYLFVGEEVTVADLFNLSLVASSNGATVALARSTGMTPEEFAAAMNKTAVGIGMVDSSFVEPVGLDSRDVASARDVARLVHAALQRTEIRDAVLQREYRFSSPTRVARTARSTDELLGSFLDKPPYVFLGGKTGFIQEAGYCFGAAARNEHGDGVIAVVLGADSKELRFKEVKSLIFWAFDAYRWPGQ